MVKFNDLPTVSIVFVLTALFFVVGIVIMAAMQTTTAVAGDCTFTVSSDSTDYFAVNNFSVNTTAMADDELFGSYSFMTPRLNFTRNVTDVIIGGNTTVNSSFHWINLINFSSTLVCLNGSFVIPASNYTLRSGAGNLWFLTWNNNSFYGYNITCNYNKTFVKNFDDFFNSSLTIYNGSTTSQFITQNSATTYGADKTFILTNLGNYVNNSNWAVGWTKTTKTCPTNEANTAANTSITNVIAAMGEIPNNWLTIIAVIIAAAVLVGLVVSNLGKDIGRV